MPQRLSREFEILPGHIVDTTPSGSIHRTATYAVPPARIPYDTTAPLFVPGPGLFGGPNILEIPRARYDYRSLEELAELRARRRAAEREQEERYGMYGEDHRSRDHLIRERQNRSYP